MSTNAILRAHSILELGMTLPQPDMHAGDGIGARVLLAVGGPRSRFGTVCCGASIILDIPYDAIDAFAPVAPRKRPALLHVICSREPTHAELKKLIDGVSAEAPGSIVVIPLAGAEAVKSAAEQVRMMRDTIVRTHEGA